MTARRGCAACAAVVVGFAVVLFGWLIVDPGPTAGLAFESFLALAYFLAIPLADVLLLVWGALRGAAAWWGWARPGSERLADYRRWFYAAAVYNAAWGSGAIVLADSVAWRAVGMFVLVYAPAYWWVARRPAQHPHLVAIGLLGKVLGPIGFVYAAATGQLPPVFGLTILTNDVLWWPAFAAYLRTAARARGGWRAFLAGE